MVGIIDVEIQAANPSMPLFPMRAFEGSPSSIRVRNVPKRIGKWAIEKIYFSATYPDNANHSIECVLVGGVWVGTIEGCNVIGHVKNGYSIFADGTDENGNVVTDYCLGKGDIQILDAHGITEPLQNVKFVQILSAQPTTPNEGDMWQVSGAWYVQQDGQAWAIGDDTGLVNQLSAAIQTKADISALDTYAEKSELSTKQNALTNDQLMAVNSGITSYKVAQIGTWQYPFVDIYASEQPATWTYSGYDVTLYDVGMEPYFDISLGVWQMSMIPIADPGDVFFLTANGDEQSTVLNFYGDEYHPVSLTATQFIYQRIDVTSYKNNILQSNYFQPEMPIVLGSIMGQNTRMDDFYITIDGTALSTDLSIAFNSNYVITQNRFHPRSDAETDFVIKAGCWNVYMVFEYRENNFMVSRWVETEGGAE